MNLHRTTSNTQFLLNLRSLFIIFGVFILSNSTYAACTYTVTNQWDQGFNATIKISNTTDNQINGWQLQWQYSGSDRVNSGWNANLTGNNPYVASNVSWNTSIPSGAYVEFGVQGSKQPGTAEIPQLTGSACDTVIPEESEKAYLQMNKAQDHIFVYVNGVEKMRWSEPKSMVQFEPNSDQSRIGEKIDITSLLAQGENEIKIVASADSWSSLTGGYDIKLWFDNDLILNEAADEYLTGMHPGIIFEETVTIDIDSAPASKTLSITSAVGGEAIYINNVFTGKVTPAQFQLAPGEYRLGLGESTVSADQANSTVHITGQFRQQDIIIAGDNLTIDVTQLGILNQVNTWRVAMVPYLTVYQGLTRAQASNGEIPPTNDIGLLTSDDIEVAKKSIEVTSAQWLLPMSYGLMQWEVTVLPAVEEPVYHAYDDNIGHELRWNSAMVDADLSQYDLVIHVIPTRTASLDSSGNRQMVAHPHGGYAGRPNAYLPADWLDGEGTDLTTRLQNVKPSTGLLHESLHNYDNYRLNDYNGIDQLHGAEVHSFSKTDCGLPSEWICWYTHYIRSQVGENTSNLYDVVAPNKVTGQDVSTYVGLFNLMRAGRGAEQLWSYSKPMGHIQNAGTQECLDVTGASTADNVAIIPWNCQTGDNQIWSFKHVQNGTYHLVSYNSGKCAEMLNGVFSQQTCGVTLNQRYLLNEDQNGAFTVKTLGDQCLAISAGNEISLQACDADAVNQTWTLN